MNQPFFNSKISSKWIGVSVGCLFLFLLSIVSPLTSTAQNLPIQKERLLTPNEFKDQLKGPILSFPTPFTENYQIDYRGIEKIIDSALAYGCKVVALTSGNSKYDRLSFEEIRELTRFVIKKVEGKALTIASTGSWDREEILDYVAYAEFLGATAVQVARPKDLEKSENIRDIVQFYREVAAHTSLGIILHGYYSVDLLKEIIKIPSVVGMKEDVDYPYYVTRQILFGDRLAIFGGGNDARYLHGYPYGSPAYYSTLYTYAPQIGLKFWQAIQKKDLKTATEIAVKYDLPFINAFSPALWQAAIEYSGGPQRYIRPLKETLSETKLKDMRELFSKMGLSPALKILTDITKGTPLPPRMARGGHIGGMVDGSIIVAGGNNWSEDKATKYWLKDAVVFKGGEWVAGPSLAKPVAYAMYASDPNGLYFAGGTEDGKTQSKEAYRLTSLEGDHPWESLPKLPIGVHSGAGAILNGKFYVTCGTTAKGSTNQTWALDLGNPKGRWQKCTPVPGSKRIFPSLVASGKYLYLLGGVAESTPLNDAYRYDPEKDSWTRLPDLSLKGYAWVSEPIDEGHLLITGRADDSKPFAIHKDVWIVDLKDMSMKKTGELAGPTTTATLIKVKEGEWWLIGGEPDGNLNRSAHVDIIDAKPLP